METKDPHCFDDTVYAGEPGELLTADEAWKVLEEDEIRRPPPDPSPVSSPSRR